jgi:hypothetical protein
MENKNTNLPIPTINQVVKYNGKDYKIISCNFGGKCKIKKLHLPNKGSVLNDIDISELKY